MKIKHVIAFIIALLLLSATLGTVMFVMSTIRDEIDITETATKVFADFKEKAIKGNANELTSKEAKMCEHWDEVKPICLSTIDQIINDYSASSINYDKAVNSINCYSLFPLTNAELQSYIDLVNEIEDGRTAFEAAESEADPITAAFMYAKVNEKDNSYYTTAKEKLQKILNYDSLKTEIYKNLSKNLIDESLEKLYKLEPMWNENDAVSALIDYAESYKASQEDLVRYKGNIEVLSVRNLMAFPEIVYSENSQYTNSYDSSLITPSEFLDILNELYNNDYILVSVNDYTQDNIHAIELPAEKKPFILVIEDLTYPRNNLGSGVNEKLSIDTAGDLCTITDGVTYYDNESILILESFLHEHPDFTYKGARGCISLTGYDSIFGYSLDSDNEILEAQKVADHLKSDGWTFASHSYSYINMQTATQETLEWDTKMWQETVGAIVGETQVYIWPYGSHVRSGEKHTFLYDNGYNIFMGLGIEPYRSTEPDGKGIFFDRRPLSGYALKTYGDEYSHLFDTEKVIDTVRSSIES